jgi:integrase
LIRSRRAWLAGERRAIEQGTWIAPALRRAETKAKAKTVAEYAATWIAERKLAARTRHPVIPTIPQLAALADAIDERFKALILIAAWTGLRFGEVIELRRKDIRERLRGGVRAPGGHSPQGLQDQRGQALELWIQLTVTLACSYRDGVAALPWTTDADLRVNGVHADLFGPSLDQLYQWWSAHS